MINDDRQGDGRGTLRDRLRPQPAPAELRKRVRESLAARGLLQSAPARAAAGRWTMIAAAAVICFATGVIAGRRSASGEEEPVKPKYALVLYGGLEGDTGVEHDSRAREYGRWAAGLSGDARWVGGEELSRALVEYPESASPASERPEPVVGFFLIDAASDDVAKRIARQCPHLKYGGRVVVHPVAG